MLHDKISFHIHKVVLVHVLEKKEVYGKDLDFMQKSHNTSKMKHWLGTFHLRGLRLRNLGEPLDKTGWLDQKKERSRSLESK